MYKKTKHTFLCRGEKKKHLAVNYFSSLKYYRLLHKRHQQELLKQGLGQTAAEHRAAVYVCLHIFKVPPEILNSLPSGVIHSREMLILHCGPHTADFDVKWPEPDLVDCP